MLFASEAPPIGEALGEGAPVTQIAVLNRSKADDADLAFAVEAMRVQLERDFGPAWRLDQVTPTMVPSIAFYSSDKDLPVISGEAILCTFVDKLEGAGDGTVGYHTDVAGLQFLRILNRNAESNSHCLSHEALEWLADPTAGAWSRLPLGLLGAYTHIATEVCDPCENDSYLIEVTIFGERRQVRVSDFALPSYFDPAGKRPFTFLDTVDAPFGLSRNGGGYRILLNANTGQSKQFFAETSTFIDDTQASATVEQKLANPDSRLSRRLLASVEAPHEL